MQKLYERIRDREDIQVLTLNADDSTGLIEPFLKENKFTFPVLVAKSFMDSFSGSMTIPTNWIADRTATLRVESIGFGGDGEEWIKKTLEQMQKIREEK